MAQQLACESCGAPLSIDSRYIKTISCEFCGASYMVSGSEGLRMRGKGSRLADYPSFLKVGQRGIIKGRGFQVLGRVRYSYTDGFWEEWQIAWDDKQSPPAWLEEDAGYWTLFKRQPIRAPLPAHDDVAVGAVITVNNQHEMFVTEKRHGQLMGMEGQFSAVLPLEGKFGYLDGTADGKPIAITYWEDEIEVEFGTDLEPDDIDIQA